jgi:SAM-dependent methyltransferase
MGKLTTLESGNPGNGTTPHIGKEAVLENFFLNKMKLEDLSLYRYKCKLVRDFSKKRNISLDIGCREGKYLPCYESNIIIGIDVSRQALRNVKSRIHSNVDLVLATVVCLPFKNKTVDFVLMSEVIEHLKANDTMKALSEVRRIIRKGGDAIITTPNMLTWGSWRDLLPDWRGEVHEQRFCYRVFKNLLRTHFNDVKIVGYGWINQLENFIPVLKNKAPLVLSRDFIAIIHI